VSISHSKDFESHDVCKPIPIHARARGAGARRPLVDRGASSCAAFLRREALPSDEKHGEGA